MLSFQPVHIKWYSIKKFFKRACALADVYGFVRNHQSLCQLCLPIVWVPSGEILIVVACEQQKRRSACASAQADQRLCHSLSVNCNSQTNYRNNFDNLASLCSWTGWFEPYLVAYHEGRFYLEEPHIMWSVLFSNEQAHLYNYHKIHFNKAVNPWIIHPPNTS